MERRKFFGILWGVLTGVGLCIILVVGWMVSKDYRFNIYKNSGYAFSIKYPASWTLKENKNGAVAIFLSPLENKLDIFQENVNVVVQDFPQKPMSLDKYTKIAINQMQVVFKEAIEIVESNSTYVAGHPAYNFVFIGKGPESEMKFKCVWVIIDEKRAYQITYGTLSSQYDKYLGKVNSMIQSFKIY